jgi:hypothetical protein
MSLVTIMEAKGQPTLKAIAMVVGVVPHRMYSIAKQPMEGQVYDAKVFNWDAIEKFLSKRLNAEKGFGTMEDLVAEAHKIDEQLKTEDGRRTVVTKEVIVLSTGKTTPKRRYDFPVGAVVLYKDEPVGVEHTVVFTTDVNVVIQLNGTQELKLLSNGMANYYLGDPSKIEEDRAKRIEAAKVAAQAAKDAEKAAAAGATPDKK